MGLEEELLRDKDIIWQCVSCNKCTYACPRDVNPEGVMKATAHWLELKGHTEKKPSMVFDEAFSEQVFATGKIEDGRVLRQFFARTKQPLFQDWLIALVRGLASRLPVGLLMKLGLATLFHPRTRGWKRAARRSPNTSMSARRPTGVRSAYMRMEPNDERQVSKSRLLPRLRA